jgi:hypothetical protein
LPGQLESSLHWQASGERRAPTAADAQVEAQGERPIVATTAADAQVEAAGERRVARDAFAGDDACQEIAKPRRCDIKEPVCGQ